MILEIVLPQPCDLYTSFTYICHHYERRCYIMLIIPIKDGENIDRALKRFKRKFDKTGAMRQLRARKQFIKPSVKNRQKIQKAQYIQNLRDSESI
jgi:small subunit ribosomal protein S21